MIALKTKDLMVGDWVMFHTLKGATWCKVSEIYRSDEISVESTHKGYSIPMPVGKFEPVILTDEILEMNGFTTRKNIDGFSYYLADQYYDVYISEYPNGWWLIEYDDHERESLPTEQIAVVYVHQLQQALRMFGVDKNIDL